MHPSTILNNLFVLEMANNHMGNIEHGLDIIRQFGHVCKDYPDLQFAFKLQYRDLDTFIQPSMRERKDVKYIKRFTETRLTREELDLLVSEIRKNKFLTMSTPFDEISVDLIEKQNLDIIKIASCSFTDWPLLEKISSTKKPIIASTAGATLEEIDRVVSFFIHREKNFAILHCVGEYPTNEENMHLSQIDFLRNRYQNVRIGFSTHEDPSNTEIIKLAIAKGACVLEKHVGIQTDKYPLNAYSANPQQFRAWLEAAFYAKKICGIGDARLPFNKTESESLRSLRRGVFASRPIEAGETLNDEDVYFAFPTQERQFTANEWSKYAKFTAYQAIRCGAEITQENTKRKDIREKVWTIAKRVKSLLEESRITVPGGIFLEISHHYGLDRFEETGLTMLTIVNRGYCKKLLVLLPGQAHPEQFHKLKEETFHILFGEVHLTLNGETHVCQPGDIVNVEPGVRHSFLSPTGAVIEEISSTHFKNDSFYIDESINQNSNRKTVLMYWMD